MSYGRYGMKMRYNPYASPQEQLGESLGTVLGTIWGENYNRRGIEKGEQEALSALYGVGATSPTSNDDTLQGVYGQGLQGNTVGEQQTYANANSQFGIPGGNQAADAANNVISPQDAIQKEKWEFVKNKYGGKTPNPTGDEIIASKTANTISTNLANLDLSKVPVSDPKMLNNLLKAQLRKNGRTEYQIGQIMDNISPMVDAKVKEHNDGMYNDLFEQYKYALGTRDYTGAQMIGSQMAKYNPEAAKIAMAGLPTMHDQYNVAETNKRMDKQHQYKVADMAYASELSKDQARFNHDLSFNDFVRQNNYKIGMVAKANGISYEQAAKSLFGVQQNKANDQRMTAAKEIIADAQAWTKNNPDVPYPNQGQLRLARNYLTGVLNGGQQLSQVPANVNDYNQMQDWLNQMKEADGGRHSDAQLAALAQKVLGENGGYLNKALKDRGWIK